MSIFLQQLILLMIHSSSYIYTLLAVSKICSAGSPYLVHGYCYFWNTVLYLSYVSLKYWYCFWFNLWYLAFLILFILSQWFYLISWFSNHTQINIFQFSDSRLDLCHCSLNNPPIRSSDFFAWVKYVIFLPKPSLLLVFPSHLVTPSYKYLWFLSFSFTLC